MSLIYLFSISVDIGLTGIIRPLQELEMIAIL